jgi:mono/diheme cytochrome c family protein
MVAALLMLAPAVAVAQDAAPASPAEAPAAADAAPTPAAGTVASYTDEQAKRGKKAYTDNCSTCHGTTLGGSGEAPGVVGEGFRTRWLIGSPEPFFSYISSNMPADNPGSLPPETYADIAAYLMSKNHVPAGDTELPHDAAALTNITLPPLN